MGKPILRPTTDQTYSIEYADCLAAENFDFTEALNIARSHEYKKEFEKACNTRFLAFQRLVELIPDNEDIELDWNDENCQSALLVVYCSAIDHFLVGDWEMAAAMFEMLLELDPEDHLEATIKLAYTYVAMEEYDSFDEVINDVNDKLADKAILTLWSEFCQSGKLLDGEMVRIKSRFADYFHEFTAEEHPITQSYLDDINSDRPSRASLARELWIQTEHMWKLHPEFIEALRNSK